MRRKQLIFIEEYLAGASGAQAAIRAGYSANSARQIASENLTKPYISEEIQKRLAALAAKRDADTAFLIRRLTTELNADLADLLDARHCFLPPDQWPEPWRQGLVKSFKFKEVRSTDGNAKTYVGSVVLSDRYPQLEMLAKILGAL